MNTNDIRKSDEEIYAIAERACHEYMSVPNRPIVNDLVVRLEDRKTGYEASVVLDIKYTTPEGRAAELDLVFSPYLARELVAALLEGYSQFDWAGKGPPTAR